MPSKLRDRKTRLRFETDATFRERGKLREIILEPTPHLLYLKLKGQRKRVAVSYQTVIEAAYRIEADRKRAEKKAAKRAGKL